MKNKFRNNKKSKTYRFLLVALLVISVGYALLTATLKVRGSLNIAKNTWNVYFANVDIKNGSVAATTVPTSDNATTKEIEYAVNFTKPGDFYEFTVDIVNAGTIDAMITGFTNNVYEVDGETEKNLPDYLESTITYADGVAIQDNHLLAKRVDEDTPTTEKIKVRVAFKTDITPDQLPKTSAESLKFKVEVTYQQADETAKPVRVNFVEDSWSDIISAYESGNTAQLEETMEAGTTRDVDLGTLGTHKLRIANLTPCSEVSVSSKTACGLVLEFADIITIHRMNPYNDGSTNGDGNKGGWEYSDMRAYLNSGTYAAGSIDYSTSGILKSLPSDLQSKIIDTAVVSGYGSKDTKNFTTTDKLYLLSPHEVWNDVDGNTSSGIDYYDKSYGTTRQLDYYEKKGVTTSSYAAAIKQDNGSNSVWWLCSAVSITDASFFYVGSNGGWYDDYSNDPNGVAPAFRLAE